MRFRPQLDGRGSQWKRGISPYDLKGCKASNAQCNNLPRLHSGAGVFFNRTRPRGCASDFHDVPISLCWERYSSPSHTIRTLGRRRRRGLHASSDPRVYLNTLTPSFGKIRFQLMRNPLQRGAYPEQMIEQKVSKKKNHQKPMMKFKRIVDKFTGKAKTYTITSRGLVMGPGSPPASVQAEARKARRAALAADLKAAAGPSRRPTQFPKPPGSL